MTADPLVATPWKMFPGKRVTTMLHPWYTLVAGVDGPGGDAL